MASLIRIRNIKPYLTTTLKKTFSTIPLTLLIVFKVAYAKPSNKPLRTVFHANLFRGKKPSIVTLHSTDDIKEYNYNYAVLTYSVFFPQKH
jgi:hypothetical protein